MTTETLANPGTQSSELGALLQSWVENPPLSMSIALSEQGIDAEALENYARSGLSPDEVEALRKVLVQGAASENPDDGGLLARMLPLLDPRERAWDRVLKAKNSGELLSATVSEATKGGLVVDLGVRGFVPASQVGLSVPRNLQQFVGRELRLRVLEVDRRRQTVILSNRAVMEEERASKRKSALEKLEEGQVRPGVVRRLTDIGAFVDVGGVDGLLHVSEISWKRVEHPSEVLKVGQKVQVKVLRVDAEAGRISLSMRRLTGDPWEEARRKYAMGSVLQVKIGKLVAQGAEVELEEGLDGFIPISELAPRRITSPDEVVQTGQEVTAVVIDFRPRERRIVFSLRKLEQKKERTDIEDYQRKTRRTSERTTLGDLFGHLFEEYQQEDAVAAPVPGGTAAEDVGGERVVAGVNSDGAVSPTGVVAQSPEPEVETGLAQDASGEIVAAEGLTAVAGPETADPESTAALESPTADAGEIQLGTAAAVSTSADVGTHEEISTAAEVSTSAEVGSHEEVSTAAEVSPSEDSLTQSNEQATVDDAAEVVAQVGGGEGAGAPATSPDAGAAEPAPRPGRKGRRERTLEPEAKPAGSPEEEPAR